MIAVDTNILVYAHREDSEWHDRASHLLSTLAEGTRGWAVAWPSLHEFLAIVTHPRIFKTPTPMTLALGQLDAWLESPSLVVLSENDDYFEALRDLVRAARQSIEIAHDRLARGEALLIFGEGTRSRTRELQLMMKGVDRYLDPAGTWVMPVGITGSDEMYPIGDDTLYPVRIVVTLGRPVDAQVLRDRCGGDGRVMMDAVGLAIASLLPPEYRGTYDDAADLGEARAAFDDLWG